jgi:hypothetical protein
MIRGNVIKGGLEGDMNDDEDGVVLTMVDPRRSKNEPNRDSPWINNRLARRVKTTGTEQVAVKRVAYHNITFILHTVPSLTVALLELECTE